MLYRLNEVPRRFLQAVVVEVGSDRANRSREESSVAEGQPR